MKPQDPQEPEDTGRELVVLASERTLLSWLRLALGLMGLGFVLDRFGIFLRLEVFKTADQWLPYSYTFWMGVGLVVIGALTSAAAGIIHTRFRRQYAEQGIQAARGGITLGIALSVLITLAGLVTIVFLVSIPEH